MDMLNPVKFFKSLADETRLRCILLIHEENELCVCELTAALDEIQPKISRHLANLKSNGLLLDRKQGQWVFYRINPALPEWCLCTLQHTVAANTEFVSENRKRLHAMGERPERLQACC